MTDHILSDQYSPHPAYDCDEQNQQLETRMRKVALAAPANPKFVCTVQLGSPQSLVDMRSYGPIYPSFSL